MEVYRRKLLATLGLVVVPSLAFARRRRRRRRGSVDESRIPLRFRGRGIVRGQGVNGPMMSRDELKKCVEVHEILDVKAQEVEMSESQLNAMIAAIDKKSRDLEVARTTVNQYDSASVKAFNSLVAEHEIFVDGFNAQLPAHSSLVDLLNRLVNRFNKSCTASAYYQDDMIEVLEELGLLSE